MSPVYFPRAWNNALPFMEGLCITRSAPKYLLRQKNQQAWPRILVDRSEAVAPAYPEAAIGKPPITGKPERKESVKTTPGAPEGTRRSSTCAHLPRV
jgi:hypothetical protein